MGLFKKKGKEEKEKEPEYYLSPVGVQMINYHVYYMRPFEKVMYALLAFIVGAAVAYLFYGGIGQNEFGEPTMLTHICNSFFMILVGGFAAKIFVPLRRQQIILKRQHALKTQFRELLDAISTSISAGQNVIGAFKAAHDDLLLMYSEKDYIIQETKIIVSGINNNIDIETMLMDLGRRSAVEDIESFANVFETAYRKGGDIKEIIQNSQQIISEKMDIENQIETMVASNKMEQNIMMVMPIMIVGMIKMMGEDMASNFTTPTGIVATTIGIGCFVAAYYVGKSILDIKI